MSYSAVLFMKIIEFTSIAVYIGFFIIAFSIVFNSWSDLALKIAELKIKSIAWTIIVLMLFTAIFAGFVLTIANYFSIFMK